VEKQTYITKSSVRYTAGCEGPDPVKSYLMMEAIEYRSHRHLPLAGRSVPLQISASASSCETRNGNSKLGLQCLYCLLRGASESWVPANCCGITQGNFVEDHLARSSGQRKMAVTPTVMHP